MAHILDVRAAGGELVVLGDHLVPPTSSRVTLATSPGSMRRNPDTGEIEFFIGPGAGPLSWQPVTFGKPETFVRSSGGTMTGDLIINSNLRVSGFIDGEILAAQYAADIAERYAADQFYEPGTVLIIGGEQEVTITRTVCDVRLAGVVSTNPAYRMNCAAGDDATHPYIALRGRVPVKIANPVSKGDLLTTSQWAGHAMKAPAGCPHAAIIGKALSNFDGHFGMIEVMV